MPIEQLVGLESPKKLRADLLSAAGCAPLTGLSAPNFVRGFTNKSFPTPGTGSVPTVVWGAIAATTMGKVLAEPPKRELLETELSRWAKAIGKFVDGDGEVAEGSGGGGGGGDDDNDFGDEDDEDDEDYEPWELGPEHGAETVEAMKAKCVRRQPTALATCLNLSPTPKVLQGRSPCARVWAVCVGFTLSPCVVVRACACACGARVRLCALRQVRAAGPQARGGGLGRGQGRRRAQVRRPVRQRHGGCGCWCGGSGGAGVQVHREAAAVAGGDRARARHHAEAVRGARRLADP